MIATFGNRITCANDHDLPSYNRPQPVTNAVRPMKFSSESGTQTGMMLGWKTTGS